MKEMRTSIQEVYWKTANIWGGKTRESTLGKTFISPLGNSKVGLSTLSKLAQMTVATPVD